MIKFANASLFDGTSMRPGRFKVAVEGDKILSVDVDDGPPAQGSIDLQGMTLMPGMITGHLHPDFYKFTFEHNRTGVMLGTELPPGVLMAIAMRTCNILLRSGFTGYLGASCSNDIDAQLRLAISEGIMRGPRIRACGHHMSTTGGVNDHPKWWLRTIIPGQDLFADGPQELRKLVREDIRRGAQTIKIFASTGHGFPGKEFAARDMSRDEIEAVVNAAHERGAKVRAHVADKAMMMECIELGVDILDHGDNIDAECIDMMVKKGSYWVPSAISIKTLIDLGFGNDLMRSEYANVLKMLPVAQAAGVRILAGDDYSGIYRDIVENDPLDHQLGCYARELSYYSAIEGICPADVLGWVTRNPGELLGENGAKVGVIEPGAIADLIVVNTDPTQDIDALARAEETIKAVICNGEMLLDRISGRLAEPALSFF